MVIETKQKVDGLTHLEMALTERLPAKAAKKVIQRALKKASAGMRKAAKTNARRTGGSGALSKAVTTWNGRTGKRNKQTAARIHIGPRRGGNLGIKAALLMAAYYGRKLKSEDVGITYGHLVEFGFRHRSGKTVPARPFLGPAQESYGSATVTSFGDILGAEIEKEALKLAAQQRPSR
jgi:hypothetical protein